MNMLPDERDRLTRVETKLDHLIDVVAKVAVDERLKTLETFKDKLTERIAWITGAFSALGLLAGYVIKYLIDHLSISFGSK